MKLDPKLTSWSIQVADIRQSVTKWLNKPSAMWVAVALQDQLFFAVMEPLKEAT